MTSLTTPPLLQKEDAKILEQVQRIAARYVYNDYTDLVVMVKESIEDGPYVARLCILYKMQHKLVNIDPSGSRTRGSRGVIQERINSEVYYNSFFPRTTGQPRYVKLAYLEYTAYVEVIIHSRIFPLYCTVIRPCLCQTRLS